MRMIAPLSRLAIWAKAIISIRSDAERTAIFPVPPIELMKGNPKRFLAPLLNGWRSVKNKEAGVKQTNRKCLE